MNDTQELLYGYDVLLKKLEDYEERNNIPYEQRISSIHDDYTSQPMSFKDNLINALYQQNKLPFIVSFSHEEDSLPLWNMYSGNGTGLNLCFWSYKYNVKDNIDVEKIKEDDIIIFDDLHINDVSYEEFPKDLSSAVDTIYEKFLSEIKYMNNKKNDYLIQAKTDYLATMIVLLGTRMKNKAFSFEKEARFIVFEDNPQKISYRTNSNGSIVPYIEKEVPITNLKSITIGPCANYPATKIFIDSMLKQNGLDHISITSSKVPFRVY